MSGTAIRTKRMTRAYRQTIDAPADVVFPLLCPVREAQWLDGWEYEMLYSASGLAEEGAVFATRAAGEEDTVWVVTRHDPAAGIVEFTRFTPRSRVCVLKIAVSPDGVRRSHVDVSYTYTPIAAAGDAFLAAWSQEVFLEAVVFWEKSMNHFLNSGTRLPRPVAALGGAARAGRTSPEPVRPARQLENGEEA